MKTGAVHLIARAGDKRALCGAKRPMPVTVVRHAPMHRYEHKRCVECHETAGLGYMLHEGRLF